MFEVYNRVDQLPPGWDEIVEAHPFLKMKVLKKLEELNPCNQRYHLHKDKKIALVSYQLKLDMFTFTNFITLKIPINIIGIPMSVSPGGYSILNDDHIKGLCQYIKSLKGFYVVLNSDHCLDFNKGYTLPTCRLQVKWKTLGEYVNSMRSHYRYRLKKAIKRFEDIKIEELKDNELFNEEMYSLYEEVYNNSKEKLEKLSIDFFRSFPSKIIKFTVKGKTIGFLQLLENNDQLVFLFGGFQHNLNQQYDLYINMLLQVIHYGIEKEFKTIELGQTAEETKSKLGAIQHPKYMYLHHSNGIINGILNKLVGWFSYKNYQISHRVFKDEGGEV